MNLSGIDILTWLVIFAIALVLVVAGIYFGTRYYIEKFQKEQKNRADNIIQVSIEQAKRTELE